MGAILAGGAADLDGRLQIGDEITHINGHSVVNTSHLEVVGLMGDETEFVVLGIRRKIPMSESLRQDDLGVQEPNGPIPGLPREVTVHRPDAQTKFGFVLESNNLRAGCMICKCLHCVSLL